MTKALIKSMESHDPLFTPSLPDEITAYTELHTAWRSFVYNWIRKYVYDEREKCTFTIDGNSIPEDAISDGAVMDKYAGYWAGLHDEVAVTAFMVLHDKYLAAVQGINTGKYVSFKDNKWYTLFNDIDTIVCSSDLLRKGYSSMKISDKFATQYFGRTLQRGSVSLA